MLTYTQLINNTLKQYINQGPEAAYNYIENNHTGITGIEAQIYNFRYATASAAGLKERALSLLEEAVITRNHWYSEEYLNSDDDLDILREDERFQKCLTSCSAREEEAKSLTAYVKRRIPAGANRKEAVLIPFHGNMSNITYEQSYWVTETTDVYDKHFLQSPSVEFSGGFSWNDNLSNYSDAYEQLQTPTSAIYSGFSAGGHMALDMALKHPESAKGLFLLAPWLPNIDEIEKKLSVIKAFKIPIYILCGDQDDDCYDCTQEFIKLLDAHQLPYAYDEIKDLEHDYPENFEAYLNKGLAYIEKYQIMKVSGFDEWAGSYDKSINALSQGYPFEGYYHVLNSIQKIVNSIKISTVLDMGVGTGLLSKSLYDQDYDITGIDFSDEMINEARKKMPYARFFKQDFKEGLPKELEHQPFEAIISSFALHHLADSEKVTFLNELYSQLAYGGLILIGDISFLTADDMAETKALAGNDWDDTEFYYCAEQLIPRLSAIGLNATYQQLSSCAGLLKIIKM